MRPSHIAAVEAADVARLLCDPALRARAAGPANAACAAFVRAVTASPPPLQHAVPVLALGRATAALALLFGDPALIDVAAAAAHRALHDGSVTPEDIFGRPDHAADPGATTAPERPFA